MLGFWEYQIHPWISDGRLFSKGSIFECFSEQDKSLYLNQWIATREDLERLLPSEETVEKSFERRFLLLNPTLHGIRLYPVVHLKCDFGKSPAEVRFQMALFQKDGNEPKATGFRLESPEGEGDHNLYHLQMIRCFEIQSKTNAPPDYFPILPPEGSNSWIPNKEPTFPLFANDATALLLCVLVGLYGLREVESFLGNYSWGHDQHIKLPDEYKQRLPRYRSTGIS
jgi:hypothetical protein